MECPFCFFQGCISLLLEVVSKPQIVFESKAQADEKAQSRRRRDELHIKRSATQLSGDRWDFKATSGSSVAMGIACRVRQINEKAQSRPGRDELILGRSLTQLLSVRCIFKMGYICFAASEC